MFFLTRLSILSLIFWLPFSALASDIYKIIKVAHGDSLNLRAYPSPKSRIKVAIPHNASWLIKLNKRKVVGSSVWNEVIWNKEKGWVNTHYIAPDPVTKRLAAQRQQCIANPGVKNKVCCGYPASQRKRPFRAVNIFSIRNIASGKTTPLRTQPGKGKVVVAIPHNAKWISGLGQHRKLANGQVWQYVRWNGQNGWINNAHVVVDKGLTQSANRKRKLCLR